MPRRKDTEIYTYKLKSGKTKYGFKTYVGINKENGKAIKVTRQGFNTRKEAEAAKTKIKADGAKDVAKKRKKESNKKTVQEVYDVWLDIYRTSVKGSSVSKIKTIWKNEIQNEFGENYIDHIDIDHLQQFADNLAANMVKFRRPLNLLHRLIKYAIMRDWCSIDPFEKIIIPKKSLKKSTMPEKNFYELNELKEFLNSAKEHNLRYYTYFMLLGSLGLRRGEALALKWKNISFDKMTVHIEQTVTRDENNKKHIGPTKTPSSNRILTLSDNLARALKEYRNSQVAFYSTDDYIFHTRTGNYISPSSPEDWINSVYKYNPSLRKITPHGFRHTLATLLYDGNDKITPKDVQTVLGHKRVTTALDIYTHVTKKQKENIKDSINNLDL